ncbi:hypothetical protein [Chromobacterium phragmitis]|uniref:hypothetical protein n=1 Tax=Chromobacterium phragmitis TaxID=2202141 RepID=UPI00387837CD
MKPNNILIHHASHGGGATIIQPRYNYSPCGRPQLICHPANGIDHDGVEQAVITLWARYRQYLPLQDNTRLFDGLLAKCPALFDQTCRRAPVATVAVVRRRRPIVSAPDGWIESINDTLD